MKIQLSVLVWYKADIIVIIISLNVTSSRHDIAAKLFIWPFKSNDHSLTHTFMLKQSDIICRPSLWRVYTWYKEPFRRGYTEKNVIFTLPRILLSGLFMAFNATFNNISDISWLSVLLVEETRVHRCTASHWQTLSQNVVSSTPRLNVIRTHNVSGDRHW